MSRGLAIGASAGVVALAFLSWRATPGASSAGPDGSAAYCTWGGTPVAPSGTFRMSPGLTNTPSTVPIHFVASGELVGSGACAGSLTFTGVMKTGATCAAQQFEGQAAGVPGVARFSGVGVAGAVHEFMYDRSGNIVGADQPQSFTAQNIPHFTDCNTPQGLSSLNFSSAVELFGTATASSNASQPRVCTWGGTAAAPTGTFTINPGLTNAPSTAPSAFHVTGQLAGAGCHGTLTYDGQIDAGGTCLVNTFEGDADGIPGVARFAGVGVGPTGPARLYDRNGTIVGSENADITTIANAPHFTDCGTPSGFTGGTFSSTIVLFLGQG